MKISIISQNTKRVLLANLVILSMFLTCNVAVYADNQPDSKVLAVVNGTSITTANLSKYSKRRGMPKDADPAQQQKAMLEELINRELIYQDAKKLGIDKKTGVMAEIENQRINIVASAMLQEKSSQTTISDADLKNEYERFLTENKGKEYKARHILLENEKDAKKIIAELDKGADFITLAKEKSTGPSGENGGDLGWFKPGAMVKPFTVAVEALEDGKYSKLPIKTQFGWHVILREKSRAMAAPTFDSLKEQIRMRLQNKSVESYIATLRKSAKIEKK